MRRLTRAAGIAVLAAAMLVPPVTSANAAPQSHSEQIIFDGGNETFNGIKYHSFRIPSLIRTKKGTLIAFVEGRANNHNDFGNINLLFKRSTNNGRTWSKIDEVAGNGQGVWGNPTAVVDQSNGKLWLFMNYQPPTAPKVNSWDDRQVWASSSVDDGVNWSTPKDFTKQLKPKKTPSGAPFNWDSLGPGVGIQTRVNKPGRLVIPGQFRNIYSDDHGATWKVQPLRTTAGKPMEETGENSIVELANGTLYRNDRPATPTWERSKRRWVSTGSIEKGFKPFAVAPCLLDPKNQASVLRYNNDKPARLVFLNSASTETRTKMRIRVSLDEGRTWRYSRPLSDAPLKGENGSYKEGGYSSMTKTNDYHVGALVEVNENVPDASGSHRSIAFRKVNLPWMLGGATEPGCKGGI